MSLMDKFMRKESIARYTNPQNQLERTLTAKDLVLMGIGTVIGAGIFILPGTVAAQTAGPSISISFIVATIICMLSAMCYAEFASALPVSGSAFSYGSVVFGEGVGWILGWSLLLEYILSVATVSTGWSAYFQSFLSGFGIHIPKAISGYYDPAHGTYFNLFAVIIVVLIALLLLSGNTASVKLNNIIVIVKVAIVLLFIIVGAFYVKPTNWSPFMPFGSMGILHGASLVFFAYLGFDCVSSSAGEAKNPQRSLPIGIIGTLVVCTGLYIAVSLVLTGMVKYTKLNVPDPVAFALHIANLNSISGIIALGAIIGMFTMMLNMIYGGSRLLYSMGRDGLLPKGLKKTNHQNVPKNAIVLVTIVVALMGGFISLDALANLVNIGTLIAFFFVSLGILPLRHRKDLQHDGFKVPWYPVLPIISAILVVVISTQLPLETWVAAIIWFIIGLILYFSYGIKHSMADK